ncbi:hypothetical protein [Bradyrhizobium sp. USDA 3650]
MNFILFIMFFITPPNKIPDKVKNTADDHRVWTLQSTSVMDFNTMPQCKNAKDNIAKRIEQTNTLKVRAWCIGKGTPGAAIASDPNAHGVAHPPEIDDILPLGDTK